MQYETVFILTPVLSDARMKEAVEKFTKVLTDNGAEIVNSEDWGLRKLAYPIRKSPPASIARLNSTLIPSLSASSRPNSVATSVYSAGSPSVGTNTQHSTPQNAVPAAPHNPKHNP